MEYVLCLQAECVDIIQFLSIVHCAEERERERKDSFDVSVYATRVNKKDFRQEFVRM